ncbi:MAG: hypothetical protein U0795_20370 [Pirellulales bacterium]
MNDDNPKIDGDLPLLLDAHQAAALFGRSPRTWRSWNSAGMIPRPIRIQRSTLWRADELRAWVSAGCPDRQKWERIRRSAGQPSA